MPTPRQRKQCCSGELVAEHAPDLVLLLDRSEPKFDAKRYHAT